MTDFVPCLTPIDASSQMIDLLVKHRLAVREYMAAPGPIESQELLGKIHAVEKELDQLLSRFERVDHPILNLAVEAVGAYQAWDNLTE